MEFYFTVPCAFLLLEGCLKGDKARHRKAKLLHFKATVNIVLHVGCCSSSTARYNLFFSMKKNIPYTLAKDGSQMV